MADESLAAAPADAAPAPAFIDAHVHVWDPHRLRYAWLDDVDVLNRPFLPGEIDRADGATTGMVFVQASCRDDQSLDEARWVASLSDAWPELAAIVAAVDLRSGRALHPHLNSLAQIGNTTDSRERTPGRGTAPVQVAGVRHLLQDEPDDLLHDPDARAALLDGLRQVAASGLTFDVCVRHWQLGTVVDLLEQIPELPVVLDHLGKPPMREGITSVAGRTWAQAIDRLARLPLAHVKLSGLAAEASADSELDAHAGRYLVHALHAFGPQRSMIGSDWPVSALTGATGTLAVWRDRVRHAASAAGAGAAGVAAIESGTATRFYRLVAPSVT